MHVEGKVFLAGLVWLMLMQTAHADSWKVTGALAQSVEYDDNIQMRADESTPIFGYKLHPSFGAIWNTATMNIGVTGRGDIRRYDDTRWDCEGFSLGFNQQYQKQLNVFSLSGGYTRECSSSSQTADEGISRPNSQEDTYSISPAWSWQWSALDLFSISPSYSQTSYSNTGSSGNTESAFRGNKTYSLNLSENHIWTHRFSSTISLFFSRSEFDNLDGSLEQSVFGFQIDNQYAITRKWSISAGGGFRWVKSPSGSQLSSNSDDGLLRTEIANFSLNYNSRKTNYSLSYSGTVSPSALGQLNKSNSVRMKYDYSISRQWKFNIDGSFSTNESIGANDFQTDVDRTYYNATVGLSWHFAKEWQLSANYRYRRQDYANSEKGGAINSSLGEGGISNSITVNLNYNWDGLRASL